VPLSGCTLGVRHQQLGMAAWLSLAELACLQLHMNSVIAVAHELSHCYRTVTWRKGHGKH
jgi:hypothetical protein